MLCEETAFSKSFKLFFEALVLRSIQSNEILRRRAHYFPAKRCKFERSVYVSDFASTPARWWPLYSIVFRVYRRTAVLTASWGCAAVCTKERTDRNVWCATRCSIISSGKIIHFAFILFFVVLVRHHERKGDGSLA